MTKNKQKNILQMGSNHKSSKITTCVVLIHLSPTYVIDHHIRDDLLTIWIELKVLKEIWDAAKDTFWVAIERLPIYLPLKNARAILNLFFHDQMESLKALAEQILDKTRLQQRRADALLQKVVQNVYGPENFPPPVNEDNIKLNLVENSNENKPVFSVILKFK